MLSERYLQSAKNLEAILTKIIEGAPPERFTNEHLKGIGFPSSNDRSIIPLLKDLGFLSSDGKPTQRYLDYRDRSRSKSIMAEALRESYDDLFLINENLSINDKPAIIGRFKSTHGVSDVVAERQAATFLALLQRADLKGQVAIRTDPIAKEDQQSPISNQRGSENNKSPISLNYRIEIHLPATRDIETYNAIFKSLKENLLDD